MHSKTKIIEDERRESETVRPRTDTTEGRRMRNEDCALKDGEAWKEAATVRSANKRERYQATIEATK